MSHETAVQGLLIVAIALLVGVATYWWYEWYIDRHVDSLSDLLRSLGLKVEDRPLKKKTPLRIAALGLVLFSLGVVGMLAYQQFNEEPRVVASGEGPGAAATPPAANVYTLSMLADGRKVCAKNGEFIPCPDRSSKEALDSTAPCDFTDRKELQQAMIACTKRGSTSVSKHIVERGQCFFFECGDGKR